MQKKESAERKMSKIKNKKSADTGAEEKAHPQHHHCRSDPCGSFRCNLLDAAAEQSAGRE